jgi:hypothetical protein
MRSCRIPLVALFASDKFELPPETLSTNVNLIFERLLKEELKQGGALQNAIRLLRK